MNAAQEAMVKALRVECVVQEVLIGMMERIGCLAEYLGARARMEALRNLIELPYSESNSVMCGYE